MSAPPHEELALRAEPLPEQANRLMISDGLGYEAAAHMLLAVQALLKEALDFFREPKSKAAQAHQAICDAEKKITDPLTHARDLLKQKMSRYILVQMEQTEIENRRAREEEAARHAEELEAQAQEAESQGASLAEVRAIFNQPVPLPTPLPKPISRIKGVSTSEEWIGEVTDIQAFLKAALTDKRLLAVVEVHQGRLNQLVQVLKKTLADVPGLRLKRQPTISASRIRGYR